MHPQESYRLLVDFIAQTWHFLEVFTARKSSIGRTVGHNILSHLLPYARYITKQRLAGRIEIHSYLIYAADHSSIQLLLERSLIYIVLILPHSYRFGFYFDQFCQGIRQTATYRDCPTDCYIIVRELIASHLGSRIYRCSCLTDHKNLYWVRESNLFDKTLCFTRSSTVAYANGLYTILLDHGTDFLGSQGRFVLWGMRKNRLVVE